MAKKTLTMTIEAEEAIMRASVDAFVRNNGWYDKVPDPENKGVMTDNPVSQEKFAEDIMKQFISQNVKAYTVAQAKKQAAKQAEDISDESMKSITLEVKVN